MLSQKNKGRQLNVAEWGFNPDTVSALGTAVAALSLIIAIIGAWMSNRHSRKERNLQAFVVLSMDIRQRWESDWGKFLREDLPRMNAEERQSPEVLTKLDYMLNWLDWMGLILKMGLIEKELLLGTLRPMIGDILRETADKIRFDKANRDELWWANVEYIAGLVDISLDNATPAVTKAQSKE